LPVDRPDDVGQRDLIRWAGEPEPAVWSALAPEDPGTREMRKKKKKKKKK